MPNDRLTVNRRKLLQSSGASAAALTGFTSFSGLADAKKANYQKVSTVEFIETGLHYEGLPDSPRAHRDPVTPYILERSKGELYIHPKYKNESPSEFEESDAVISLIPSEGRRFVSPPGKRSNKYSNQRTKVPANSDKQYISTEYLPLAEPIKIPTISITKKNRTFIVGTKGGGDSNSNRPPKKEKRVNPGEEGRIEHRTHLVEYYSKSGIKTIDDPRTGGKTQSATYEKESAKVTPIVKAKNHGLVDVYRQSK